MLLDKKTDSEKVAKAYESLLAHNYDDVIAGLADNEFFENEDKLQASAALGQAYFAKKNFEKSTENYEAASSLSDTDKQKSYYQNLIGNCLREAKKYDDAVKAYEASVKLNARNELAWINLINILVIRGNDSGAEDAYTRAINANPGNITIKAAEKTLQADR